MSIMTFWYDTTFYRPLCIERLYLCEHFLRINQDTFLCYSRIGFMLVKQELAEL